MCLGGRGFRIGTTMTCYCDRCCDNEGGCAGGMGGWRMMKMIREKPDGRPGRLMGEQRGVCHVFSEEGSRLSSRLGTRLRWEVTGCAVVRAIKEKIEKYLTELNYYFSRVG